MRTSTHTSKFGSLYGDAAAIRAIAKAGFDCYDYSAYTANLHTHPMFGADWQAYADSLIATAQECGITCNQSHAPFPSAKPEKPENAAYNEIIFDRLVRSIEFAARLGAKTIVVHPARELPYLGHEAYYKDLNMDLYRSLAPAAKAAGIKIALENMFNTDSARHILVNSACGDPREFVDWLDTLADDCFTACLDVGHCAICSYPIDYAIRTLGPRLTALHVHDNDGRRDWHFAPFAGKVDWAAFTGALREIGYAGDMTLEADGAFSNAPEAMYPEMLAHLSRIARYLADEAEASSHA